MPETPSTEAVRRIVGYAVRTAAAHGVAQAKHGEDRGSSIDALIDQAVNEVAARDRETAAIAKAEALEEALRLTRETPYSTQTVLRTLVKQAHDRIGAGDE